MSVPSRAYAEAISDPDAPAPTTARVLGSSSSAHASSVPITRPPNWVPGIGFLTDPVARMIVLASIRLPFTVTAPAPASAPSPSITSIPFFLNSPDDATRKGLDHLQAAGGDAGEVDLGL